VRASYGAEMTARRYLVDALGRLAILLRRRRTIDPQELVDAKPVKLNLGSGLEVAPGWINVDASLNAVIARWPRPLQTLGFGLSGYKHQIERDEYLRRLRSNFFVHTDLTEPLPFASESADFIFCSHLLEHLTRAQGLGLLTDAHRILRPRGTIRVAVPDLDVAIALYAEGKAREMLDHYFYRPESGRLAQHRSMYNYALLAELLREAGFATVERREYREGTVPDLRQLDNRPEESLFVEASKGLEPKAQEVRPARAAERVAG
jgi:predicted SAM-dependent methyltransferase